jgi:hypothetical protein
MYGFGPTLSETFHQYQRSAPSSKMSNCLNQRLMHPKMQRCPPFELLVSERSIRGLSDQFEIETTMMPPSYTCPDQRDGQCLCSPLIHASPHLTFIPVGINCSMLPGDSGGFCGITAYSFRVASVKTQVYR